MRLLRKVVFINSAVFTEADIDLKGNISFNGTNDSGKTAIQRGALFFYEHFKQKLGMPSNLSFNDFYLRGEGSYLIYEIEKDDFVFMLVVTQGSTSNDVRSLVSLKIV